MPTPLEKYEEQLLQDDQFDYNKAMQEYKEAKKPLLNAIISNYKQPVPQISPEQEKKARYGAALSDTFSSLAQMFAHGQGAQVQRNQNKTSAQLTNARLQSIRDKYNNDLTRYQAIKGNAAIQDLNMYLSNARHAGDKKREYVLYKAKQAATESEAEKKRLQTIENDKRKFEQSKQLLNYKAGLVNKTAGTGRSTGTGTKTSISPTEAVNATERAEKINKDWLVEKGYMQKKTEVNPVTLKPQVSYQWDAKATPAIRKELSDRFEKEQQAKRKTNDPLNLGL